MRIPLSIGAFGVAAIALSCATPGLAQVPPSTAEADCHAQQTALEKDMRAARSRGQMLRRRQIEENLHALQARCAEIAAKDTQEARVMRQKNAVMQLRIDLDRAEEELRKLIAEKK